MEAIDTLSIDTETLLKRILEFSSASSFTGEPQSIRAFQKIFLKHAENLDADSIWIELADDYSLLLLRKRPQAKRRILFVGHADVAKGAQGCCIREEGGKLFGPGVADMKGGLALLLHALSLFEEMHPESRMGWDLALVPDEEGGSRYSKKALQKIAEGASSSIIVEPAYEDGSFVSTRSGSLSLKFTFKGVPRHAGRSEEREGHALYAAARLTLWIEGEMQKGLSTNVGMLTGGKEANTTADCAELIANIRADTLGIQTLFLKNLEEKLLSIEKETGCRIEMEKISERPPKSASKDLERLLEKACSKLNIPFSLRHSRGVTDGNDIAALGIPTLDTMGVVGSGLHSNNEHLLLKSLSERCKLLLLFLIYLNEEGR